LFFYGFDLVLLAGRYAVADSLDKVNRQPANGRDDHYLDEELLIDGRGVEVVAEE